MNVRHQALVSSMCALAAFGCIASDAGQTDRSAEAIQSGVDCESAFGQCEANLGAGSDTCAWEYHACWVQTYLPGDSWGCFDTADCCDLSAMTSQEQVFCDHIREGCTYGAPEGAPVVGHLPDACTRNYCVETADTCDENAVTAKDVAVCTWLRNSCTNGNLEELGLPPGPLPGPRS